MSTFTDGYICSHAETASGLLWDLLEMLEDDLSEDELKILRAASDICDKLSDELVDKTDREDL